MTTYQNNNMYKYKTKKETVKVFLATNKGLVKEKAKAFYKNKMITFPPSLYSMTVRVFTISKGTASL